MEKIICPSCSKPNNIFWLPIKSFIVSYGERPRIHGSKELVMKPVSIIQYYDCHNCQHSYSLSLRIEEDR